MTPRKLKATKRTELSIIIPCYCEGPTFEQSVNKIVNVLKKQKYSWEIIFVEDKSVDDTRSSVEKLVKKLKEARAIYHKKNEGRGRTVADGMNAAKGNICGYLDVDLEVSCDYIPLFVSEIENGFDMAVGKRFYEGGGIQSLTRVITSKGYAFIVKTILGVPVEDTEAGYKFFRTKNILPVLSKVRDKKWFWDTEICARAYDAELKISEVPVLFVRRPEKKSTVRILPDSWEYLIQVIKFKLNN